MNSLKKYVFFSFKCPAFLVITLVLLPAAVRLSSQTVQKPSRQTSLEAFSKGNYELAYDQFSELLVIYPGDPGYKYYSGVCLVKLERDPARAANLLKQAIQAKAPVKNIPSDAYFWLGRAQQLTGKFNEAVAAYYSYTDLNGKKAARDLGIPEFISQCEKSEGRLPEAITEEKKIIPAADKPEIKPLKADSIPADYDRLLSDGLDMQFKADSVNKIASEMKKGLDAGSYTERTKMKERIAAVGASADSLQRLADSKYAQAQDAMNRKPFTGTVVVPDTVVPEKQVITPVKEAVKDSVPETPAKPESVPAPSLQTVDIYSVFEIREKAPDEKISIDPSLPGGLVYRIQVAVFRNPVAYSYFRGIVPVSGFRIPAKDVTVYYAGLFRKISDANKALAAVRKIGFKDAFVAAHYEGKPVSAEKATVLEKEWGNKPVSSVSVTQTRADTIPPTLTFRVEIIRSARPVKDDVLEGITKIAGTRGLEIVTLEDKTMIYLIGTFLTYESAEEYTDLLLRNGYSNAKVGAWLGKKEIPVETARELFERIE